MKLPVGDTPGRPGVIGASLGPGCLESEGEAAGGDTGVASPQRPAPIPFPTIPGQAPQPVM